VSELYALKRKTFPSPLYTLDAGIVAVSVTPTVENLLEAYSFGIFPWPHEGMPLLWFCPDQRGVLDFSEFHVSKKLRKELRKAAFTYSWDRNFSQVMRGCQQAARAGESGTWITDELIEAYERFHAAGYAHSVEVWQGADLVGGLYGVYVAGVFSAESMFFKVSPASKAAVVFCVEFLKGEGLEWMDVQMVSAVSKQFGAKYISKNDFLRRLEREKKKARAIFPAASQKR
jgi:leucyl/phenylalanyl-tRNA--protein transferase